MKRPSIIFLAILVSFLGTLSVVYSKKKGKKNKKSKCISSGNQNKINNALAEEGDVAILCKGSSFEITAPIEYTANNQRIYTQGFPRNNKRALIKVSGKDAVVAINSNGHSGAQLQNVIVDGNRKEFGIGTGGLLEFGGGFSENQLVEWVKAYDPRGWSVLVLNEGHDNSCTGSIARNNELGPAGKAEYIIADGISLACKNSIVENNTIVDATDGGIVIFQAPGSKVRNNIIRTKDRIMFYGISMVDTGPHNGDFTGTEVTGNIIDAEGELIRYGIAMGPNNVCSPDNEKTFTSFGATVNNNTLKGTHMGYGFLASGVSNWTVLNNTDESSVEPYSFLDICFEKDIDPPGGFQFQSTYAGGNFQSEFKETVIGYPTTPWPIQAIFDLNCLKNTVGNQLFNTLKAGGGEPIVQRLEESANGPLIDKCISQYDIPETPVGGDVIVSLKECSPNCITLEIMNSGTASANANLEDAKFFIENLPVDCPGLAASLEPNESSQCTISDFVAEDFQVINWYGLPTTSSGIGFTAPFTE